MEYLPTFGQVVRDLRRQRNMTGGELGDRAGLSQSKISKLEAGIGAAPKAEEIKKILNILQAPQSILQQYENLDSNEITLQIRPFTGQYPFRRSYEELRQAKRACFFAINLIPSLLQTLEYRQALARYVNLSGKDDMNYTLRRQDLLWDRKRRFHFILHEAALYNPPGNRETQIAQLDRLERFIWLEHIKLGVLAVSGGTVPVDITTFGLYDDRRLSKAVGNADTVSYDTAEIVAQARLFAMLDKKTDYGDAARTQIRKAIDFFQLKR